MPLTGNAPGGREALLAALRSHYLFAAFTPAEFERIAPHVTILRRPEGGMLFQRGEPAAQFFVVLEGEVRLVLRSRDGLEKVVQVMRAGQSFAEAIMFMQLPLYPVSAQIPGAGVTAAIGNEAYLAVLRDNPAACLRMLGDLSSRLHGLISDIESLTLETAQGRLTRHLLSEVGIDASGAAVVRLAEPKQVLAARLAIKPETLSRILRALSDEGLIAVEGREIRIPDVSRLRAIA